MRHIISIPYSNQKVGGKKGVCPWNEVWSQITWANCETTESDNGWFSSAYAKKLCWMLCLHRHLTQEEHPLFHPYRRPRCNLHEVSASARYHPVQLQGSLKSPLAFWPRSLHSFRYGRVRCWVELRTASLQLGGKLSIDHGSSHCSWLLLNSSSNCIFRGHIYPRYVVLGGN